MAKRLPADTTEQLDTLAGAHPRWIKVLRRYRAVPLALFCISLLMLLAGALWRGPFVSIDSHAFLSVGHRLIALLLGGPATGGIWRSSLVPHYMISSILLSAAYSYTDLKEWGVVALNSVLFSAAVCMVFAVWQIARDSASREWINPYSLPGIGIGLYIIYGLPDVFLWSYAILTDIIFLFWVAGFVVVVCKCLQQGSARNWLLAFLISVTAPFVRPTGLILPLVFIGSVGLRSISMSRTGFRLCLTLTLALPAIFVLVIVPMLVVSTAGGGAAGAFLPPFLAKPFFQAVYFFSHGIVISNRFEVPLSGALSYSDVVRMEVYRLLYYWVPIRLGAVPYSTVHNCVNLIYMVVTIPLLVVGAKELIGSTAAHRRIFLFLVMTAYGYALLQALTLVSFDWRYQLPAMIPFWIVTGCGAFSLAVLQSRHPAR